MDNIPPTRPEAGSSPGAEPRRGFLALSIAVVLGAVAYLPPMIAGLCSFLHPLRQKGQSGRSLRVTTLENLPDDGVPRKFPVVADRDDAWTHYPQEPIGAVFLARKGDQIEAFQVVCPHAGCFVNYEAGENKFFCPCHNASFDRGGKRMDPTSPSPRDLDTLEVEVRNQSEVWVQFQNFRTGTAEKVPT